MFSINFESGPELVFSGSLSVVHGMDIVRDGSSFSLPIVIHRKKKHSPQKFIKVENGHRRGFFRPIRMRSAISKHIRCQTLWLILPFWWVQPEIWRSLGSTSDRRSCNDLLSFICKYLPSKLVTFIFTKSNPMSSFLIGLCRKIVIRFILIYLIVNRLPKREM